MKSEKTSYNILLLGEVDLPDNVALARDAVDQLSR